MAFDNPGKIQITNGNLALNAQDFLALGPASDWSRRKTLSLPGGP